MPPLSQPPFLPSTPAELAPLGWSGLDVLIVTGDAHLDHPAFPAALLGRLLVSRGYRVAVVPRPLEPQDLAIFGAPRLFVAVAPGTMDSMVANYTALKKPRRDDPFWPPGDPRRRPDRALINYCNLVRRAFGKAIPLVAGGVEASMRRFAHYDFWSDSIRRPVLLDCGADLLLHGMGEGPLLELAAALDGGATPGPETWATLPGAVWKLPASVAVPGAQDLPSVETVQDDPLAFVEAHRLASRPLQRRHLRQTCAGKAVLCNPAWAPRDAALFDEAQSLPYSRNIHPIHGVSELPALTQVRFSVCSHRGCFGGCAFCSIGAMQGKDILTRPGDSVLAEIRAMTAHPAFRGTIQDLGGPSANMYGTGCTEQGCTRLSCLFPNICSKLNRDQGLYLDLLARASALPGVRHLFVTTGLRSDLAAHDPRLLDTITRRHTSGHLKLAPEHISAAVLEAMRKPGVEHFDEVLAAFRRSSSAAGRTQFLLPYFMAAHPGCTMGDMVDLAEFLADRHLIVEQCQIFTPTPGTASSVAYATGISPDTGEKIFVERDPKRKELQKALALRHLPEMRPLVLQALRVAGRPGLARKILPPPPTQSKPRTK